MNITRRFHGIDCRLVKHVESTPVMGFERKPGHQGLTDTGPSVAGRLAIWGDKRYDSQRDGFTTVSATEPEMGNNRMINAGIDFSFLNNRHP